MTDTTTTETWTITITAPLDEIAARLDGLAWSELRRGGLPQNVGGVAQQHPASGDETAPVTQTTSDNAPNGGVGGISATERNSENATITNEEIDALFADAGWQIDTSKRQGSAANIRSALGNGVSRGKIRDGLQKAREKREQENPGSTMHGAKGIGWVEHNTFTHNETGKTYTYTRWRWWKINGRTKGSQQIGRG